MSEKPSKDETRVWEEDVEVMKPDLGINDMPKTKWEFLLYSWQHTLVDISPFVLPLVVAGAIGYSFEQGVVMVQAGLVAMMIATLIQTNLGNRLPMIQGPSSAHTTAMSSVGSIYGPGAMWAAAVIGGLFETLVGASKVLGVVRRFLPPFVCGIIVVTIGANLGMTASGWVIGDGSAMNFILAGLIIIGILVFTILGKGGILSRGAIFFSMIVVGLGITTVLGVANWSEMSDAAWFAIPIPFQFGGPWSGWELVAGAIFGAIIGYIGSIVESIGDYATTCAASNETYKVKHINRGITAEGVGATITGILGSVPVSSYSQNVGIIATTKIASRYVVMGAAVILGLYGLSPKVGSLLLVIPRPAVGAVFLVCCGMIMVTGIRLINTAPKNDRVALNVAIPLMLAIGFPIMVPQDAEWFTALPDFVKLVMTNGIIIAVILGVLLNIILRTSIIDKDTTVNVTKDRVENIGGNS